MAKMWVFGLAAPLLAAIALAGAASAQAPAQPAKPPPEPWVYLHFADGAMAWNLNAGRWSDNNNIAEGQRLLWYAKPEVVDGHAIVWAQDFWKIDCKANTLQIKSGEELGEGLRSLFNYKPGEPKPILPGSTDSVLKLVYCDNKEIAGAKYADGILEVIDALSKPPAR